MQARLALVGGQRLSSVMLPLAPRGIRSPERRLSLLMGARWIMQSIRERLFLRQMRAVKLTRVGLHTR